MKIFRDGYAICAINLLTTREEYLPQKFDFEGVGGDIRISRGDFSIVCNHFYVDTSEYQPDKYFLVCAVSEEKGYCYSLLSTDLNDESNILLDGLLNFYYNEEIIQSGFVAVFQKTKWEILFITGDHRGKTFSINSFFESKKVREGGVEFTEELNEKGRLEFNGLSGKVLQFIFSQNLINASPVYCFSGKGMVIIQRDSGYNIMELDPDVVQVFKEDVGYISLIRQEVGDPVDNSTFFQDANALYYELVEKFSFCNIVSIGNDEKKYFNIETRKYLTWVEIDKIEEKMSQYKNERQESVALSYFEY